MKVLPPAHGTRPSASMADKVEGSGLLNVAASYQKWSEAGIGGTEESGRLADTGL